MTTEHNGDGGGEEIVELDAPTYTVQGHRFDRTFTDEQIERHFRTVLELVGKIKPPKALIHEVYAGVNAMVSDVTPRDAGIAKAPPALHVPRGKRR